MRAAAVTLFQSYEYGPPYWDPSDPRLNEIAIRILYGGNDNTEDPDRRIESQTLADGMRRSVVTRPDGSVFTVTALVPKRAGRRTARRAKRHRAKKSRPH